MVSQRQRLCLFSQECHEYLTTESQRLLSSGTVACAGYRMCVSCTCANGVITCILRVVSLMICSTRIPRTVRASAMSDLWHLQGTASAHINTTVSGAAMLMRASN